MKEKMHDIFVIGTACWAVGFVRSSEFEEVTVERDMS